MIVLVLKISHEPHNYYVVEKQKLNILYTSYYSAGDDVVGKMGMPSCNKIFNVVFSRNFEDNKFPFL